MTEQDKQLLIKVLCELLPYRVKVEIDGYYTHVLKGIDGDTISTDRGINYPLRLVKPYLRPMSSMTEEEQKEFVQFHCTLCPIIIDEMLTLNNESNMFDWLNEHHFDCRGLIEKGLALEAAKDDY
jgi:hypothetical protein